jgi:hypothetical protein
MPLKIEQAIRYTNNDVCFFYLMQAERGLKDTLLLELSEVLCCV